MARKGKKECIVDFRGKSSECGSNHTKVRGTAVKLAERKGIGDLTPIRAGNEVNSVGRHSQIGKIAGLWERGS